MDKSIIAILDRMKRRGHSDDVTVQMEDMANLLAILSEEQAQAAATMERQTAKLVALTRIIVILTVGLLAYTAALCFLTLKLVQ